MKTIIAISMYVGMMFTFNSCAKNRVDESEISNLEYLREEEKLARDVYLHNYEKYGDEIFRNISKSEQKHMDKMLELLEKYKIDDPASAEEGVFRNQDLQNLYNMLVAKSDSSLLDALIVGAIIEDVDIKDIDVFNEGTDEKKITETYDKLACGSNIHMRAFTGRLNDLGYTYQPQYISQQIYDAILAAQSGGCGK